MSYALSARLKLSILWFVDELNVSKTEVQKKDEETITLKDQLSDVQKLTEDQSKMVVDLQGEWTGEWLGTPPQEWHL